ncbi:MAG: galactose mutarotase [Bacteroidales bacterium]|nr:galactose mutarotase [Bacteroidales bacterium]
MERFTITNGKGMTVEVADYGARIVAIRVPDRDGVSRDVVLGFDHLEDYRHERHANDFGAAIGRYANRLGNGRIVVDGRTIQLPQNNGPHTLHGGPDGWQYRRFDVVSAGRDSVVLHLLSPDGDNGFPGNVEAKVAYRVTDDNGLQIDYAAVSDQTTVINMTNHSYFNLNGDGRTTVLNHLLTISADQYMPNDETFLPIGVKEPVAGTPFDFRSPKAIGRDIEADHLQLVNGNGYDHNYVLEGRGGAARLESPLTGIVMEVWTTAPGMQLYTGNFLDGSVVGKGGVAYTKHAAVCLETQLYPDSPNRHWAESSGYLHAGEMFESHTCFKFSIADR